MINCLKDIKFDVIMDEIKVVQCKLFEALILLDDLNSFHSKKTEETPEKVEINPRLSGVIQAGRERDLWEKVFVMEERISASEKKEPKSSQILKQAIVDSLREIEFDVARSEYKIVSNKLALAVQFLHRWINSCPEKEESCTYEEWNRKRINELSLKA